MDTNKMYYRIRNVAGFLGMLLPYISILGAWIMKCSHPELTNDSWWWSISATYYQTPALAAILCAASMVLITYDGYDWRDNLVTTLSGVCGFGIILFPCSVSWFDSTYSVGFFQLPMRLSHRFHCIFAVLFFGLLAVNSLFLFTLGESNTKQKRIRNIVYRVCGIGIIATTVLMVILQKLLGSWIVIIAETIMLQFFGISWLTKGGLWLKDKEDKS